MDTRNVSQNSWRKWYATYGDSNVVRLFPNPVAEATAARAAVQFGTDHGLDCIMMRATNTLKR